MQHQRGHCDLLEHFAPVAIGDDRREMPRWPFGIEAALNAGAGALAQVVFGSGIARRTDRAREHHPVVDQCVLVAAGGPRDQRLHRLGLGSGQLGIARGREDRGEREAFVRMARGEMLRDHPAHAGTDDMRFVDPQCVEQPGTIIRHVGQRVRHFGLQADLRQQRHLDDPGRFDPVEFLAQPDIAIVVADDAKSAFDQGIDQFFGPQCQLRAEAHDQKHRRIGRIAPLFVVNFDPVRRRFRQCRLPVRWLQGRPHRIDPRLSSAIGRRG